MSLPPPPSIEEVCAQALKLPCSPELLPRLIEALHSETSTATEIERIISLDNALATATLRLANSAYYGQREPVAALDQAILMLGEKEIYRVAAMVLVGRWGASHFENLRWEPGDYARHSLCTAVGAEVLAEGTGRVDPAIAYTAGLICDLGKLALAYACAPFYPSVSACCLATRCTWEQAEKLILGYHHAEVGGRLLRAWRFPEFLCRVVEHQLNPPQAPREALPLLVHVHAAKYLAVCLGPGTTEDGLLYAMHGSFLREWGFTLEFLEESMVEVRQRVINRLGDPLSFGWIEAPPE